MSHQSKPTAQVFDALHRALDLTRDNEFRSTILSRQAELVSDQGDLKQALALFSQARSVAPIDARPRTGYALTILRLQPDSRSEAMALLEQVITDSPWYSAAYIALSEISESQGDGKDAEHWLQLGLDRNKNDARLLAPLGELYAREHRIAEARVEIGLALNYEIHADELQTLARRLAELSTP